MDFYRNKRVFVTGGEGFIGSNLCRKLTALGASVTSFDRATGFDVTNVSSLHETLREDQPHIVFHLAAETEVVKSYSRPFLFHRTNVTGTLNVLELCRNKTWDCLEGIVIASSDKCYGANASPPFVESQPLQGNADPYSSSKRLQDELCHDWGRVFNLPLRVLRCANTYGPGQTNDTTLITSCIGRIKRGESPRLHHGMEDVIREWLYIDDAVEAYLLAGMDAAKNKVSYYGAGCFAYNVGSGECWTPRQVAHQLLLLMNSGLPVEKVYLHEGVKQIGDQFLNCAKFVNSFPSWKPTPFLAGLRKTVEWQRAQL